jgi:hypothetical protein
VPSKEKSRETVQKLSIEYLPGSSAAAFDSGAKRAIQEASWFSEREIPVMESTGISLSRNAMQALVPT